MEELNRIAKQYLIDSNNDGKIDVQDVAASFQQLLSDASGKLDFDGLVTKFQNTDMAQSVASWLGNGPNEPLTVDSVTKLFDAERLNKFATSVNMDIENAKNSLAKAIPELIDQVSKDGSILDTVKERAAQLHADASELVESVQKEGLFAKIKSFLS